MKSSNTIEKQGAGKLAVLGLQHMFAIGAAVIGIILNKVLPENI